MKQILLVIGVLFTSACFSQAQNKVFIPLMGSKQLVESSEFCKKYKCKAMPRENGLGYVLELPSDRPWSDIMDVYRGKSQPQMWSKFRTLMYVSVDRKTEQIASIEFQLRENFRSNFATQKNETLMIADAVYYAVGKRLSLGRSQDEPYSPDVNDCFFLSKGIPEENYDSKIDARAMLTGEITLQASKKKVKYRAACSAAFNGSTPKFYRPVFWIEIPSFTDTKAQSGN